MTPMRNIIRTILLATTLLVAASVRADDLTPAQLKMRTAILNFVKEEGFSPYIDEDDGSVTFKKEGITYWVTVESENPFYLEVHRSGLGIEDADRDKLLYAVNQANRTIRSAKAMLNTSNVSFAVEIYCHSVEEFKHIFYKCLSVLQASKEKVSQLYNED